MNDILQNTLPGLLKTDKVIKNKEGWRSWPSPEAPKQTTELRSRQKRILAEELGKSTTGLESSSLSWTQVNLFTATKPFIRRGG